MNETVYHIYVFNATAENGIVNQLQINAQNKKEALEKYLEIQKESFINKTISLAIVKL